MISPISFGSIYRINTNNDSNPNQKFFCHKVSEFCEQRKIPYTEISNYDTNYPARSEKFSKNTTIFAPDRKDNDLESYLAGHGIEYKKYSQEEVLKPTWVNCRVKRAPEGFKTVVIDSDKLENLLICQEDNNLPSTRSSYKKGNRKEALGILKSLNKFPTSTIYISTEYTNDEVKRQIDTFGKIEDDIITLTIEKTTDNPDNLMYFAMKEAGMNDIPVYMDNESYKTAQALGIVKE